MAALTMGRPGVLSRTRVAGGWGSGVLLNIRFIFAGLVIVYFLLVVVSMQALAATSTQSFVQNGSIGNQFEISSSRVALQKSKNDDVKQFAQQMLDDHTQIGQGMKEVISSENLNLTQPSAALDSKHQKLLDKLNEAAPEDFDKKYIKDQINAHKEAVSLFRDYAKKGDDPGLKDFATKTLPIIQEHLQHAKMLDK